MSKKSHKLIKSYHNYIKIRINLKKQNYKMPNMKIIM